MALARRLTRQQVPFLVTSHGGDLFALKGAIPSAMKRWVLREASYATVVSEAMRKVSLALGADPNQLGVESMGADLVSSFIPPDSPEMRRPNRVVFVGRLVEGKGVS